MDNIDKKRLNIPILNSLSEEELGTLEKKGKRKTFLPGEILIWQEDVSDFVFFILEGCIRVYRMAENGTEVNIGFCAKGDIVGEMAFVDNSSRSANVQAIQKTEVFILVGSDFKEVIDSHPDIAFVLLKIFSKRIRNTNDQIEQTLSKNLKDRTSRILKILAKFFPNNEILLSHEELASIIGATRSRVTEVLDLLQKDGQIALSHKKIRIKQNVS